MKPRAEGVSVAKKVKADEKKEGKDELERLPFLGRNLRTCGTKPS